MFAWAIQQPSSLCFHSSLCLQQALPLPPINNPRPSICDQIYLFRWRAQCLDGQGVWLVYSHTDLVCHLWSLRSICAEQPDGMGLWHHGTNVRCPVSHGRTVRTGTGWSRAGWCVVSTVSSANAGLAGFSFVSAVLFSWHSRIVLVWRWDRFRLMALSGSKLEQSGQNTSVFFQVSDSKAPRTRLFWLENQGV